MKIFNFIALIISAINCQIEVKQRFHKHLGRKRQDSDFQNKIPLGSIRKFSRLSNYRAEIEVQANLNKIDLDYETF